MEDASEPDPEILSEMLDAASLSFAMKPCADLRTSMAILEETPRATSSADPAPEVELTVNGVLEPLPVDAMDDAAKEVGLTAPSSWQNYGTDNL